MNSLLQTYFMLPVFREHILGFRPSPPDWNDLEDIKTMDVPTIKKQLSDATKTEDDNRKEFRKFASRRFMHQLQKLFGTLLLSNQSYVDPSKALNSLVNERGEVVPIGHQEDASGMT